MKQYEKYIDKAIEIFKNILNELNSIHILLNLDANQNSENLIYKFLSSIKSINLEDISNIFNNELKQIKKYIMDNNKLDIKKNFNEKKKNNHLIIMKYN